MIIKVKEIYNIFYNGVEKLKIAKNCDASIKESIVENIRFFELLNLPKPALENKIPVKSDDSKLKNSEEAVALRKDLDTLEGLKNKCMETIDRIFQMLNEDNIIPEFIRVLQKKTTEKAVS
jgi:hypothetical protein